VCVGPRVLCSPCVCEASSAECLSVSWPSSALLPKILVHLSSFPAGSGVCMCGGRWWGREVLVFVSRNVPLEFNLVLECSWRLCFGTMSSGLSVQFAHCGFLSWSWCTCVVQCSFVHRDICVLPYSQRIAVDVLAFHTSFWLRCSLCLPLRCFLS